jgi:group II intron reverse transcriptase/maturase
MQNAETVLGVLRERGRRGLPCTELYRQLFNPQMYLMAYGRIYANHGAMTPGVTGETADGMSMAKIESIIDAMRHERYRFSPARRTYIPKKNGKRRPLGLPSWLDKLVGEVVRLLLEAYYEPTFSDLSHGFRPGRGCHTALDQVASYWTGTVWYIEGDIADCFGSLNHDVMISILAESISDQRFLRLVRNMLQAGYLEDWKWHATLSGAPQGGVVSPILSSIYLHKLDEFVEKVLIPEYTQGARRAHYLPYKRVNQALYMARKRNDRPKAKKLRKQLRTLPMGNPNDPGFRRLRYVRYADDHLLGFIGPRHEAEEIKQRLAKFLRDELKLELSQEKTLITHARTRAARFLGYEITTMHSDSRIFGGQRAANGKIRLRVPMDVVRANCSPYMKRGKAAPRAEWTNLDDYNIVEIYGSRYRGIVQYYLLASDVWRLHRLEWVMETSMLKTLASKHQTSLMKAVTRYKTKVETPHGLRKCFEVRKERVGRKPLVARFGGIPLHRKRKAVILDQRPGWRLHPKKELVARLLKGACEMCGEKADVEVHQVQRLADLNIAGQGRPEWAHLMVEKRRKTLIACPPCHESIHEGSPSSCAH